MLLFIMCSRVLKKNSFGNSDEICLHNAGKICKAVMVVLASMLVFIALASDIKILAFGGSCRFFISFESVLKFLIEGGLVEKVLSF